jgi:hypothetical protein
MELNFEMLRRDRVVWMPRAVMGGAFIWAIVLKGMDPLQFADNIAAYELLP